MKQYLIESNNIKDEIIKNRRQLHSFAETGFNMPKTVEYVTKKLTEYGYSPKMCGKAGVTATIGEGGRVLLLRADMDALPMKETTDLDFASKNGNCHSCGHDCHTAMLLGAAKLLKQNQQLLKGTIKFMFQPAEELLAGAADMVEHGILENPKVDAAFGMHIAIADTDSHCGTIHYNKGAATYSGDAIKINILGKAAHGSAPYLGVDAINIAAQIISSLNTIVNKNVPMQEDALVLVGKINGGTTVNTVAENVEMEVSVRAKSQEVRELLKQRVKDISLQTAKLYDGSAEVIFVYGMPPLVNDAPLTETFKNICTDMLGEQNMIEKTQASGTEDFCQIANRVPSAYFQLGAGSISQGYTYSAHHQAMIIDENALPIGAAVYTGCALEYFNRIS